MTQSEFDRFVGITKRLRRECPWDREQTHESIRHSLIEETYEVVESIDAHNMEELRNELGDLMLHVVFHANIAEEQGEFTLDDVIRSISDKLVRRHPHVYGDTPADGTKEIIGRWEKIKMAEGRDSLLDGIPRELPALLRAHRLTSRASTVGFDWEKGEDALTKVREEMDELADAVQGKDQARIEAEYGDLLFALVNYGRFLNVNPEMALRKSLEKFVLRFRYIEKKLKERGGNIHASSLAEMDALWNEAKRNGIG